MPDSPSPSLDRPDRRGLSVLEAARRLGTTPDAVRSRLRRRTLEGYRDNVGRWHVVLPDGTGDSRDGQPTEHVAPDDVIPTVATVADGRAELVAELRTNIARLEAEVAFLRGELERRRWPGLWPALRRFWEGG